MLGSGLSERLERISKSRRILIWVATVVLLTGAFAFLRYLPACGEITTLRGQLEGIEQRLRQARIRKANLAKFEAEQIEVEAKFAEALQLLPNAREIPSLLRSVNEQGSNTGLVFQLFNPKPERARDFYVEIPVAVELSGRYRDVTQFFDRVSRMERIINILNVTMQPERPLSTKLVMRCDLVTYRFRENGDADTAQGN